MTNDNYGINVTAQGDGTSLVTLFRNPTTAASGGTAITGNTATASLLATPTADAHILLQKVVNVILNDQSNRS